MDYTVKSIHAKTVKGTKMDGITLLKPSLTVGNALEWKVRLI